MFERSPYLRCPKCTADDEFGILLVGSKHLTRRCRKCRFTTDEPLPPLDKKVIYLDQFALSEIFKVKTGTRRSDGHTAFWESALHHVERALLLQQAVFPASNIHLDESIVFTRGEELRRAYNLLSGDVSLKNDSHITLDQLMQFADAFIAEEMPPSIAFNVDGALEGERNKWLPDMHISVNSDFSHFADGIRAERDRESDAFSAIAQRWQSDKAQFDEVLREELASFGAAHLRAWRAAQQRMLDGIAARNPDAILAGSMHDSTVIVHLLMEKLRTAGLSDVEVAVNVIAFFQWSGLQLLPHHQISSHLYAAIARKMGSGQKRLPSKGMINDVRAIAAYAQYVDAMFIDNECAALLGEEPMRSTLPIRSRIFSLNSADDFLSYLHDIAETASPAVRARCKEIYGIE